MRTIIFTFLAMIGLAIVGVIFINSNFVEVTPLVQKSPEFNIVTFQGIDYPFGLAFPTGTTLQNALGKIGLWDVKKIYQVENRKTIERNYGHQITSDATFKIELW